MDAKAKVVNMLAVFDFELAGWEDGSDAYKDLWAARCEYVRLAGIEEAHEQLLTGLEALAGEWFERSSQHRIHTGSDSAAQLFANELTARIRTLASAGLEGNRE